MVNWTENRLNRLQLLRKEEVSATVIAQKLGPTFSKGIVLRKLRELEAERLRRAEMRAARKAAREREVKAAMRAAARAARSGKTGKPPADKTFSRRAPLPPRSTAETPASRIAALTVPALRESKPSPKLVTAAVGDSTESRGKGSLARSPELVLVTGSPPLRASSGVRLFDLRATQCRWPIDDHRPARLFCGSATVGTTSWCEHHQRIAFTGFGKTLKTASAPA
jgi:hypothetical protein